MQLHNCAECKYLTRTSPEQRFLLCKFWAAPQYPVRYAGQAYGIDYVRLHCHVQPEAPACPFFKPKVVEDEAAGAAAEGA